MSHSVAFLTLIANNTNSSLKSKQDLGLIYEDSGFRAFKPRAHFICAAVNGAISILGRDNHTGFRYQRPGKRSKSISGAACIGRQFPAYQAVGDSSPAAAAMDNLQTLPQDSGSFRILHIHILYSCDHLEFFSVLSALLR
jgi:hypothetical protein